MVYLHGRCLFDFCMREYVPFVSSSRVVLVIKVVMCWLGVLRVRVWWFEFSCVEMCRFGGAFYLDLLVALEDGVLCWGSDFNGLLSVSVFLRGCTKLLGVGLCCALNFCYELCSRRSQGWFARGDNLKCTAWAFFTLLEST